MLGLKITTWAVAIAMAAPNVELSDKDQVKAEAKRLWEDGENEALAELFRAAYAVDPQPEYLFGRAQAVIKERNCELGRQLLDQFLATSPPNDQVAAAEEAAAKCPDPPEKAPPPETKETPPPPRPAAAVDPEIEPVAATTDRTRAKADRPAWRQDVLGWALVGAGAMALVAGTSLFFVGRSRTLRPGVTANEDEYSNNTRRSQQTAWAGLGIGGAGLALAIGGAIRLGIVRRRAASKSARREPTRRAPLGRGAKPLHRD